MRHIAIQPAEVRRHAHSARAPAFAPGVRAPELRGCARASRFSPASGCGARKSRTQNVRIRENDCSGDARTTTSGALVNGRGDPLPSFRQTKRTIMFRERAHACFANMPLPPYFVWSPSPRCTGAGPMALPPAKRGEYGRRPGGGVGIPTVRMGTLPVARGAPPGGWSDFRENNDQDIVPSTERVPIFGGSRRSPKQERA